MLPVATRFSNVNATERSSLLLRLSQVSLPRTYQTSQGQTQPLRKSLMASWHSFHKQDLRLRRCAGQSIQQMLVLLADFWRLFSIWRPLLKWGWLRGHMPKTIPMMARRIENTTKSARANMGKMMMKMRTMPFGPLLPSALADHHHATLQVLKRLQPLSLLPHPRHSQPLQVLPQVLVLLIHRPGRLWRTVRVLQWELQ